MSRSVSIWLDEHTEAELACRAGDKERSLAIKTIVARYVDMCKKELPKFEQHEIGVIRLAIREHYDAISGSPAWLPMAVNEWMQLNADDKHVKAVRLPRLMEKLMALTLTQRIALLDETERAWHKTGSGKTHEARR